ncbi:MAG TPA: HAMP domain-containing sensor histidine kinase [Kofleriaceae bacterium]|nr:HAMP domain-containing sensor histidine kinase [Kofleriaceae bacterium]
MTFRGVLSSGVAALIFITVITGSVSVFALQHARTSHDEATHDFEGDLMVIDQLRAQSEQTTTTVRMLARNPASVSLAERLQSEITRLEPLVQLVQRRSLDPTGASYTGRIERAVADLARLSLATTPDVDELQQVLESVERDLSLLAEHERANFDEALATVRARAERHEVWVVLATGLGVLLSIGLAVLVIRKLSGLYRREQAASAAARREAAARQEMLAVVSHDLRNPLNVIVMGSNVLSEMIEDTEATAPVRRHVQSLARAADRMTNMIEEILDSARIDAGTLVLHKQACHARELLDSAVEMLQPRAASRSIQLRVECEQDVIVAADSERVVQILSNLIGNALKFTHEDGEVVARCELDRAMVTFEVRDTGPGIAAEQIPRIFDRYWQAEGGSRAGIGLGLYICKYLVEAHGGRIWVESTPGDGSSFRFTLPRA